MFKGVLYSMCRLELWTFMRSYLGAGELEIRRQMMRKDMELVEGQLFTAAHGPSHSEGFGKRQAEVYQGVQTRRAASAGQPFYRACPGEPQSP